MEQDPGVLHAVQTQTYEKVLAPKNFQSMYRGLQNGSKLYLPSP